MNETIGHEEHLIRAIGALPKSRTPERDLWPDIAGRLSGGEMEEGNRGGRPAWWRQAVAAGVVAAFAAGILLGRNLGEEPSPADSGHAANLPLLAAMQASEMEYQAAFRQFSPMGSVRSVLGPQAAQNIEASWVELRQAETALQAALQEYPDNPYLNHRLLGLRAQQLEFMQQLATLDQFSRRKI